MRSEEEIRERIRELEEIDSSKMGQYKLGFYHGYYNALTGVLEDETETPE